MLFSFPANAGKLANNIVSGEFSSKESSIPIYTKLSEDKLSMLMELSSICEPYWENASAFGFQLVGTEKDALGQVHFRYEQTINEVPVEFAEIIVHTNKQAYI